MMGLTLLVLLELYRVHCVSVLSTTLVAKSTLITFTLRQDIDN